MSRRPRVHFPGALYRVIARGNQKQDILLAEILGTNTNELIFFTPHPPLPLKGGGLGRGSCHFIYYVCINRLYLMTRDRLVAYGLALVAYLARKLVGQGLKRLPSI
jgi:hypothetical protein